MPDVVEERKKRNDNVYDLFNSILSETEGMENNERQSIIWTNCFSLSRWIFATDPNDNSELFYARGSAYGDRLCVFAFTDEQHLSEFSTEEFGSPQGFFIANSPQAWVESLSDSGVEGIVFNAGPEGWSWFSPIENLRAIQEYVNR